MLYLINIHWQRRVPQDGRPASGKSTYAVAARNYATAEKGTKAKFMRKYGAHLTITRTEEFADPASIFKRSAGVPPASPSAVGFTRINCGAPHPYGICPVCGKGHGTVLMSNGTLSPALTNSAV